MSYKVKYMKNIEFEIKEKITKKFGNNISFEKMKYINSNTPYTLICTKHKCEMTSTTGSFYRSKGCLCKECEKEYWQKINKEKFIQKANEIHNNKYNYSKINYINNMIKIEIICPEHGSFWQTPSNHIHKKLKQGCPICGHNKAGLNTRFSKEEFIQKAKEVHGDKYDYSKINYTTMKKKIEIICPEHGSFWQIPDNHIRKAYGCPNCDESHGEAQINLWLNKNGYKEKFIREKTFTNDYDPKGWPLPYDFYIPEKNLLIEFQGIQHFKPTRFNGISKDQAIKILKERRHYDWLKRKYARDKKIGIIYINYTDDINKVLFEKLS